MISGFTLGHNLISGGFPIIEAVEAIKPYVDDIVAVDMNSDDQTNKVLQKLGCITITKRFNKDQDAFNKCYYENNQCKHDNIIFFEADEIFSDELLKKIVKLVENDHKGFAVWRLQLEQNFQRCRWYPHPVHRIIKKGNDTYIKNPVVFSSSIPTIPIEEGFLWDVSSCFRDDVKARRAQAMLFWKQLRNLRVSNHFSEPNEFTNLDDFLKEPQWLWKKSPFNIPLILNRLVGTTSYKHWVDHWLETALVKDN